MPNEEPPESRRQPGSPTEDEYRKLADQARALREHDPGTRDGESRGRMNAAANAWLKYTTVGLQFVLVLLLPLGIGYWGDTYFGTLPWLTLVGFVLGAAGAMASIIREVMRMDEQDRNKTAGKEGREDSGE
ncbi:MAG: AtpZ/AtpI family protein [Planctomycetes bacterium]|nr:AtpZ/AtpI family protein [Planctomycetota bacterium]